MYRALSNIYDVTFCKMARSLELLTIFGKSSIIDMSQGTKYVSVSTGTCNAIKVTIIASGTTNVRKFAGNLGKNVTEIGTCYLIRKYK